MSEAVDTLDNNKLDNSNEGKESVGDFIRHTREEIDKTSFPSSDVVRNTTLITIAVVIFFAIYLFLVDQAWVYIIEAITWLINKIVGI